MCDDGSILNISSIHAGISTHNFTVYAATKGALEALTRGMAIELAEKKIRVNAIRPGWIGIEKDLLNEGMAEYDLFCERIPAGRKGKVEDIVPAALLLCSEEASYVTGQVWSIDGGHNAVLNTAFPRGHIDGGARDDPQPTGGRNE